MLDGDDGMNLPCGRQRQLASVRVRPDNLERAGTLRTEFAMEMRRHGVALVQLDVYKIANCWLPLCVFGVVTLGHHDLSVGEGIGGVQTVDQAFLGQVGLSWG